MRRLLIALTTVVAACALASPAFAANPIKITDPSGDAANVPDVVGVTIEDVGTGFAFTVELATMQDLLPDALILVLIDSDRNAQTGGLEAGVDFVVAADNEGAGFLRWNGTAFDPVNESISPTLGEGRFGFMLTKATLGSQRIDVVVISTTDSSENVDGAPNENAFTYIPSIARLVIPASLRTVRAGAVLNARNVQAQVTPVPGQTLAVQATLRCTLTARGRVIRPLAGGCRWRVPAALRGTRMTLKITATVGSQSRTQTVTVRVR